MNKALSYKLLLILAIIQLGVASYAAFNWNNILKTGNTYNFEIVLKDPSDILRGRYIYLTFPEKYSQITVNNNFKFKPQNTYYASLSCDERGVATITEISTDKPSGDYVKVEINYVHNNIAHITLPFNRFYLNEELADKVERQLPYLTNKHTYAIVKIKEGKSVIETLVLDGNKI